MDAAISSRTGRTVRHYKVGERLGAGGMGEVYRAEDVRLGREVALKFLPAADQDDPAHRERLLTEARAASALRSPHIAAIYDVGEDAEGFFIAMEFVEGDTLSRRLDQGALPVRQAVEIAMQMADALDEAHARGIVHRDIKSDNVIITRRDLVKVLDFGLAKFLGGRDDQNVSDLTMTRAQETLPGMVLGTVSYMAPEQALGRAVTYRSDIFSLGVVMYEMLTGRLPFQGDSVTEVIDRIVHLAPTAIGRFNHKVPPDLERIVRKALEKDPDYRYQTVRELYIDLRNLGRDLDVPERRSAMTPAGELPLTRSATDTAWLEPAPAARLENAVAVLTFSNITQEIADDWIGSGIAETVTADLKSVHGLSVIGRERILDVLKDLGPGESGEFDPRFAIELGRALRAAWIIGGGYQRVGELIRITARFVDVRTGALVKTVKIDGKVSELFDLQDKIVYELSQDLQVPLGQAEIAQIQRAETQSVEAYGFFSRGMINLRMGSRDSLDRAIYLLEKAIEHDPNYASAYAALGAAYDLKGSFLSLPELSHRAIEFERKALAINPHLSSAHQWLGAALNAVGRFDEALPAFKEAIRLDPANAGAHASLARTYWIGKGMLDEGIEELEQAIAINPQAGYAYLQLGLLHALRGNYERAEAACRQAIDMQERYISGKEGLEIIGAHTRLGYVYYRQGQYDEAIREYGRELSFLSSSDHALRDRTLIEINQKLGAAYLRKGMREEAEKHFVLAVKGFEARMAKGADDSFTRYYMAGLYALRGDLEGALKHLEQAIVELPALNRFRASVDPDFDGIREALAFHELVSNSAASKGD